MFSSAPSPVLASFPFPYFLLLQSRNDSFPLPGSEPLAVYTVAEVFMLRFIIWQGRAASVHLFQYVLCIHSVVTARQVWGFDCSNDPGVRGGDQNHEAGKITMLQILKDSEGNVNKTH